MKLAECWQGISAPCCEGDGYPFAQSDCICGADERILRAYIREDKHLLPMTPEQREWCLGEIHSVEGYDRSDFEGECDGGLARGVLNAWRDFCRDKGLY